MKITKVFILFFYQIFCKPQNEVLIIQDLVGNNRPPIRMLGIARVAALSPLLTLHPNIAEPTATSTAANATPIGMIR